MASVVAGGLFNAIAFAGAGYVFHKLDKNGYEKEMKRHDEAMEKLSEEKEKWYERTVEKKNKIALLPQRLSDANKDLDRVNEALHNLRAATEKLEDKEPTLNNYYEPSEAMKMYVNVVTGVIRSVSGFLVNRLLLRPCLCNFVITNFVSFFNIFHTKTMYELPYITYRATKNPKVTALPSIYVILLLVFGNNS